MERRTGSTQLKYDKAKRTIVAVTDNLTLCRACTSSVSKDWTYCPYCGAQERVENTEQ